MSDWVLATREPERLEELGTALAPHGLRVVAFPVLREVDHDDPGAWTRVQDRIAEVTAVAVTSPRAAAALAAGARRYGCWPQLSRIPLAAVGRSTAAAARTAEFDVAVVGDAGGAALAAAILDRWREPGLVVHACGRDHRPELARGLRRAGFEVVDLPVYAIEPVPVSELPQLPAGTPAAVILTSPRATEGYVAAVGTRFAAVPHVTFGAATATAATALGLATVTVAGPDVAALVEEICQTC